MATEKTDDIEEWITRIRDREMPIFGATVQKIISVVHDDTAPAADLARVVLRDVSMTARVLKLVNSPAFNPREQSINTISRAVVVLGFNTVRDLCLSIALVDALVEGSGRDNLNTELARAIHAATQARDIAELRGDRSPEEIFIATLLFRIGEMAFWCFSGETGNRLDRLMRQPGYNEEQAQDELLGFRLRQLGSGLVREWHLNELLPEALFHPGPPSGRNANVALAHQLAAATMEHGWDSEQVGELTHQLSELTNRGNNELQKRLHQNANQAASLARDYGVVSAARAIPQPGEGLAKSAIGAKRSENDSFPEPDGMLQLKILRELSQQLEERPDFNTVMDLVLEGIYRGVGVDRTLFALITPDRKGLRAKHTLGHGSQELHHDFHFTRTAQPNIFFELIDQGQPLWVDCQQQPQLKALVTGNITSAIGRAPFFIAPIVVNHRRIGLIFSDRAPSGRPLDSESYQSFCHFAKQASMGLTLAAAQH